MRPSDVGLTLLFAVLIYLYIVPMMRMIELTRKDPDLYGWRKGLMYIGAVLWPITAALVLLVDLRKALR